jgi:DNA-binding GntR family transcriptional regulator
VDQKNAFRQKDQVKFMESDRCFHIGFNKLTGNKYLMDRMHDIRYIMHLMRFRSLGIKGRMNGVVKEHEILNAVEKGNISEADKRMEYHLELSKNAVKTIKQKEKKNG